MSVLSSEIAATCEPLRGSALAGRAACSAETKGSSLESIWNRDLGVGPQFQLKSILSGEDKRRRCFGANDKHKRNRS